MTGITVRLSAGEYRNYPRANEYKYRDDGSLTVFNNDLRENYCSFAAGEWMMVERDDCREAMPKPEDCMTAKEIDLASPNAISGVIGNWAFSTSARMAIRRTLNHVANLIALDSKCTVKAPFEIAARRETLHCILHSHEIDEYSREPGTIPLNVTELYGHPIFRDSNVEYGTVEIRKNGVTYLTIKNVC